MRNLKLHFIFLAFTHISVMAQSIDLQIIGSAGGSINHNSQLEWTLGELMINEFENNNIITQGLYQGKIIITNIENIIPSIKVNIYPNPFMSSLKIDFKDAQNIKIELLNFQGNLLKSQKLYNNKNQINMSELIPGTYILRIFKNDALVKTARVIKIK